MRTGNEGTFYPEMASLTDGQLTDKQLEEELDKGRVYRLNDRFFKFLFGREDRKTLFLDLLYIISAARTRRRRFSTSA